MFWFTFFAFMVLATVVGIIILLTDNDTKVQKTTYEVRFEPSNNKYFIVKIQGSKEERVTGRFGLCTIYYEDMVSADYVLQKLNGTKEDTSTESTELK